MQLDADWIRLDTNDGPLPCFLAKPARATGPLPGVVVLQEAWGVDEHIQDVTRRFATAGYAAIAPDLFARGGARPDALSATRLAFVKGFIEKAGAEVFRDPDARAKALADRSDAERAEVEGTIAAIMGAVTSLDSFVALAQAAVAHLAAGPSKGRKIGSVGFCMGGGMSARLACATPAIAAAVSFYGMPPSPEQIENLRAPILAFYGGPDKDARVTGQLPAFEQAMRDKKKHLEAKVYDDAMHAFFNDTRGSYHLEAARDSWARVLAFYARELV